MARSDAYRKPTVLPVSAFGIWVIAGAALLFAVMILSIAVGANPLSLGEVAGALRGTGNNEANYVVWSQRVPRTAAGLLVGAALGVAGALMQAFTRNPLADTGLLGVNAGAAFFVAVGVTFFGIASAAGYVWLACLGALVLTGFVYAIGSAGGEAAGPVRLTMTGLALGAVLAGLTTGLTLIDAQAFERMRGWNAGSLLERDVGVLLPIAPLLLIGVIIALWVAPALNSVSLGADVARSQGVDLRLTQLLVLIAVTLLAGAATAIAGPMVFVGLVVPHIVRWCVGIDQRRIIFGSLIFGPSLVLLSDIVGRVAVLPSEMPVGVVTSFVGAPLLIGLVRRANASGL